MLTLAKANVVLVCFLVILLLVGTNVSIARRSGVKAAGYAPKAGMKAAGYAPKAGMKAGGNGVPKASQSKFKSVAKKFGELVAQHMIDECDNNSTLCVGD